MAPDFQKLNLVEEAKCIHQGVTDHAGYRKYEISQLCPLASLPYFLSTVYELPKCLCILPQRCVDGI